MRRIAVLSSGGLDSSVLLADLARESQVFPLYVTFGLAWEAEEQRALRAFISELREPSIQPLTVLSLDISPFYAGHWSLTGMAVPGSETADEAVFLPGRNILLLGLAAVWCATHGVGTVALGTLGNNPFPDASPGFFTDFAALLGRGLGHPIDVLVPFRSLAKAELVRRARSLPLHLTLTCLQPHDGLHCGRCNKCEERRRAFSGAGVADPTAYAAQPAPALK